MFPSECLLQRRVRSERDADLSDSDVPLYILECKDRKADGYGDKEELKIYNQMLEGMQIGVRLATPPALSYLAILGAWLLGNIVAVDKTVIVIRLGDGGGISYLIYDAVALSLRMIPPPTNNPSWIYTLSSQVSLARADASSYALVHTGRLVGVDEVDSLYLWRPSSSSSMPWSDKKKPSSPDLIVRETDTAFSFDGHAYWVDLLDGASYYSCDALLDNDYSRQVEFGFIPLPVEDSGYHRKPKRVALPVAYRAMGVVRDSIRFVSIDGFQEHVKLKNRTVTVWKLLGRDLDEPWEEEHKLSMKTLWGFEGFGDLPKDLTPMYPLLSPTDTDVVYLVLGECLEDRRNWKFIPCNARYLLAVDMGKNIVTSVSLAGCWSQDPLVSCRFSQCLLDALAGPCDDKGIPIPIPMKKKPKRVGGNLADQDPIAMKKKPKKKKKHVSNLGQVLAVDRIS